VTPARFLETRQPVWDRLEALLARTRRRGVAALSDDQIHQLSRLYPAVAVDVARARMYRLDPATQRRINQLAIAAHGLLYRRRNAQPLKAIRRFFRWEYPRLFRRLWPYVTLAAVIFFVSALGAYVSVGLRPSNVYILFPGRIDISDQVGLTKEDISERFRRMPGSPMAAFITTNNIKVAFLAFALGITAGVGTCYVLLINALMLGAFAGHFANHGLAYPFCAFILPHGALEIFAILIAAAAGLRMGISLAVPGGLTRKASLHIGAREAVLLVLGTIPMFILAGALEAYVTPSYMDGTLKIALGLAVAVATLAYLLLAGRRRPRSHPPARSGHLSLTVGVSS